MTHTDRRPRREAPALLSARSVAPARDSLAHPAHLGGHRWGRRVALLSAAAFCSVSASTGQVRADDRGATQRLMAVGFAIDLLATALSAANGKLGYAPQVWLGIGHARIRFVGAHLQPPDAIAFAPDGFRRPTTTVLATIIDYTFGPRFDGWWIGSGVEAWQSSIQHEAAPGTARWNSTVFTLGGGHIWRVAGDFFLDAWVGAHAVLNPQTVTLGRFDYKPFPLQGEGSLKVGWFLPI